MARIRGEGPKITIVFQSAEGLKAGKTKIKYRGVDIGTITAIRLSEDHKRVIATAQMTPKTEEFLVNDTRLWVVRPRISGANVTGLGTLISGAYIGVEIGSSKVPKRDLVALRPSPWSPANAPGAFLFAEDRRSGFAGYRHANLLPAAAGRPGASYMLDQDGKFFTVKIFVRAPYDQYVDADTRFWQASGIDVSLDASGLSVQTQSLLSSLIGGIAFETPATGPSPACSRSQYRLHFIQRSGGRPSSPPAQPADLPVDFQGIRTRTRARSTGSVPRRSDRRGRGGSRTSRPAGTPNSRSR